MMHDLRNTSVIRAMIRGALALILSVALCPAARAQTGSEIIRGRVFGPDSVPLPNVEVLVTGLVTRAAQTARTNANGVYTVIFANPESEYVVAVRRIGFVSHTFRLSRTGMSGVLGANVYLKPAGVLLDPVLIQAQRALPTGDRRAIGELSLSALADSLFLVDPSKLMALLLAIPGILAIDDSTVSVAGAAANMTSTLDGASVRGGGTLPPDAVASTRIITSSADPARGGFSGAATSQTLRGGTDIFASTLRASTSNDQLVWNDPAWSRPLPTTWFTSGTANGPIVKQKLRYNFSWNASDSRSGFYSMLAPRDGLLSQIGLSADSVRAVTAALAGLGVPLTIPGMPDKATSWNASTTQVFDFTPNATTSLRLSHAGYWNSSTGNSAAITSLPTRWNEITSRSHNVNARATGYVRGLLDELTIAYNYYRDHSGPYTLLPGGTVRVGTDFDDGRTGLASLTFGGAEGEYYEQTPRLQIINELSWLPTSGKHKVKVGGQIAIDRSNYFYFPGSNLLGHYTYLTLEDLVANRPASYDRVLTNTPRNTKAKNSSVWVGDEWTASKAWQIQGGLRFDFAHPTTIPRYNPAVDAAFGIRTDKVPDDAGVSPRLGFSWTSATRRGQGSAGGASTLGSISASAISQMSPELVTSLVEMQRASTLPGIGVSGTIGAYRGATNTSTIATLVESTGLPGTRVNLMCVGEAVPIPDWRTMTEGPMECADGTSGTPFSISRPLVRVFDPSFRAPVSWRGNLSIDGIRVPRKWILSLNTVFAYNTNMQSTIDVNLNRAPRFLLAGEGNRPVYAPLDAVVPTSGAVAPSASRVSPEFSSVTTILSDLHGVNAQLSASLAPPTPMFNRRVSLNLSYSLVAGRSQTRGNSRIGTAGDPFAKQWMPIPQATHTFRLSTSGRLWWFNFGATTMLMSGIPLTPLTSGDVNGDGFAGNDRAFIPNPSTTSDPALGQQISDLISHARPGARECLTSQFGRIARANSCRTPWQARIDVTASVTPPSSWNYNDRFRLTFSVANASGALVRALNLENTPFGQTSLATTPNPTLLYVTGFDPATQQFRYRVNQLFGEPTNFGSARRRFGPSQLQVGVEYRFGGPPLNPIARGLGLREPVNKPALSDEARRAAIGKLKKDPTATYLARKDSLGLSAEQVSQLNTLSEEFNARADTALTPLTRWVVRKGQRVFDQDLSKQLTPAQNALNKLTVDYAKKAQGVLTAEQLLKANPPAQKSQ